MPHYTAAGLVPQQNARSAPAADRQALPRENFRPADDRQHALIRRAYVEACLQHGQQSNYAPYSLDAQLRATEQQQPLPQQWCLQASHFPNGLWQTQQNRTTDGTIQTSPPAHNIRQHMQPNGGTLSRPVDQGGTGPFGAWTDDKMMTAVMHRPLEWEE